jgi:hypothetical protein
MATLRNRQRLEKGCDREFNLFFVVIVACVCYLVGWLFAFVGLGIKLRASCLKCSYHSSPTPDPFTVLVFQIGSHAFAWVNLGP